MIAEFQFRFCFVFDSYSLRNVAGRDTPATMTRCHASRREKAERSGTAEGCGGTDWECGRDDAEVAKVEVEYCLDG